MSSRNQIDKNYMAMHHSTFKITDQIRSMMIKNSRTQINVLHQANQLVGQNLKGNWYELLTYLTQYFSLFDEAND